MTPSQPRERTILLLVPDEGLLFEAAGLADIFYRANQTITGSPGQRPYQVTVAGVLPHRVIRGRSGLRLLADVCLSDLDPTERWDTVIVTGGGTDPAEKQSISGWLRQAAPHCRRIVSVCTGAFLLAEAGLLEGRRCTTHWKAAADLSRRHPGLQVDINSIFIKDPPIWTSAGASSGFDLALALVEEDLGPLVAREVAQYLVLYLRRPGGQSQFSRFLESQATEPGPILEVQHWALDHLADDLRVEQLADRAGMSLRNFIRVFTKQTGSTPARFVEQIRLDAARQRLEQGAESLERVAVECGLQSALTLRRVFEKCLGVSPSDYRARFGMI